MSTTFSKTTQKLATITLLSLLWGCGDGWDGQPLTATEDSGTSTESDAAPLESSSPDDTESPATTTLDDPQFLSADLPQQDLVLHLESDIGVTHSQNIVTQWWDQSGQDNSLTSQGGPRIVENSLNRMPVIEFDGESSRLERLTDVNLPQSNSDRTVVLLANYRAGSAGGLSYGATVCDGAFNIGVNESNNASVKDYCPENNLVSDHRVISDTWTLQAVVLRDSELSHYVDGQLVDTVTQNFNTVANQLVIGGSLDGTRFDSMQIAAAFVWDSAISDEAMASVEGYLIQKYLRAPEPDTAILAPSPAPSPAPTPAPVTEPPITGLTPSPAPAEEQPIAESTPVIPNPAPAPVNNSQPAPQPTPTVVLLSENLVGNGVRLSWNSENANSCRADGDWSGSRPLSGSATFSNVEIGSNFALVCEANSSQGISMVTVFNRAVEVSWVAPVADGSDASETVSEYRVRYGTSSASYTEELTTDANQTEQSLMLEPGDYYLAISSVDGNGQESSPSGEIAFRVR